MGSVGFAYCVEEYVSVALKPFSYDIHGHDVVIEACWCSRGERVDVEVLASALVEALRGVDRKPLWETVGAEDAMIEDLLLYLKSALESRGGVELCGLRARWRGRLIALLSETGNMRY
ncbi:MAG: hypothetical protein QXS85_00380 [Acidilobaceae archaeon]